MTYEISTLNSEATQAVARRLSHLLSGGEAIELISDLGGGKTTFVQGLMAGLGYASPVTSPTFTLNNIYVLKDGREVHHYDLYRLTESGVVGDELAEDLSNPDVITLIEWAGIAGNILPKDRLQVTFEPTGESERLITFTATGPVSKRIVEGMAK